VSEKSGWIHDQVAELLSAYIDGEVTAAERGLVEAHLASCDVCGRDLATLRQTVTLLRQLPQVAAPRPFTLRESDVQSLRPTLRPARPAWWQSGWLRGAVAAAAMLLCVAVAGVTLLLEHGLVGAPAAPAPVALQSQPQAPAATQAAEAAPGARGEAGKQAENFAPAPTAAPAPPQREEAAAEATAPQAATAAPAAKALQAETPLEPAPSPSPTSAAALAKPLAPLATPTPLATAPAAPLAPVSPPGPSRSYGGASPTASPQATLEWAPQVLDQAATGAGASPTATPEPQAAATMLWEVQDLSLVIEPGVITASGRLPVGMGLRLAAQLLRDGQPTDWTMAETQPAVTGVNGQFSLRLQARAGAPDFDLFAVAPTTYVIRVYAVPPGVQPGEAHISFDTYGPPAAEPTATLPAPATPTPAPARSAAPSPPADAAPTPAMSAGRRRGSLASLLTLCGAGLTVLFSAGLAAFYSLRIGSDLRQ
jgi:hypothetical protein